MLCAWRSKKRHRKREVKSPLVIIRFFFGELACLFARKDFAHKGGAESETNTEEVHFDPGYENAGNENHSTDSAENATMRSGVSFSLIKILAATTTKSGAK